MKLLTKMAIAAAGVTLACQGAFAQNGDLLIGFNGFSVSSTASDYIADLGASSTIIADAANTELNPSGSVLTSFTPTVSSSLNVGVVGGIAGNGSGYIYETTLRVGGTTYATAGTETKPGNVSRGNADNAAGTLGSLVSGLGTIASASTLNGSTASWTESVSQGPGQVGSANSSYAGILVNNTAAGAYMANFGSSSTIVEDLWRASIPATGSVIFSYVGDLTINLSGSTPSVIWDAVSAVPEPGTYGVIAGAGLLLLALRRQLVRNIA